jgi:hypothetical protein
MFVIYYTKFIQSIIKKYFSSVLRVLYIMNGKKNLKIHFIFFQYF